MPTFADWLESEGAHDDVVTWARPFADEWERAWTECVRGDWLLGIAARAGADHATIVRAACSCARFGLDYLPDHEPRPAAAIAAAERWAEGHDDAGERERAAAAGEAAIEEASDPAVVAAASAALAALRSVERPEDAASVARSVVSAAVLDAGDCAMMSAMRYAQATCADRVREHVAFTSSARARART